MEKEKSINTTIFILLLILLLIPQAYAQDIPITKSNQKLSEIEKQNLRDLGLQQGTSLVNPPIGNQSTEVKAAYNYVKAIIQNLAGEQLKKKNIKLVINIYGSPHMNAFAAQHENELFWSQKLEQKNKLSFTREMYSQRLGLEISSNEERIYEIGANAGLFANFNESEIAFVLGHEISHILEGHTHFDSTQKAELVKQWWNSQRHEAIADKQSLYLMLGKYELTAAITALVKISKNEKNDQKSTNTALAYGALEAHHHEGTRIGALQAIVEYLRKNDIQAQPRSVRPVPDTIQWKKLVRTGRSKYMRAEDFKKEQTKLLDLLSQYIIPRKPFPLMDGSSPFNTDPESFAEFEVDIYSLISEPNPAELQKTIETVINRIQASSESKQQKLDALLHFFIFMGHKIMLNASHSWPEFESVQKTVARLLVELTSGADPASPELFVTHFTKDMKTWRPDYSRKIVTAEIFNYRPMRSVFALLYKSNKAWSGFIKNSIHTKYDFSEPNGLLAFESDIYTELASPDKDHLSEIFRQELISFMAEAQTQTAIHKLAETPGDKVIHYLGQAERFKNEYTADPLQKAYYEVAAPMILGVNEILINTINQFAFSKDLFNDFSNLVSNSDKSFPLSSESIKKISPKLIEFAKISLHWPIKTLSPTPEYERIIRILSYIAESAETCQADRLLILQFIAALTPVNIEIPGTNTENEIKRNLMSAIKKVPKDLLIEFFARPSPGATQFLDKLHTDPDTLARQKDFLIKQEHFDQILAQDKASGKKHGEEAYAAHDRFIKAADGLENFVLNSSSAGDMKISSSLSLLTLVGTDRVHSEKFAAEFSLQDLQKIEQTLISLRDDFNRAHYNPVAKALKLRPRFESISISASASLFLFDILAKNLTQIKTLDHWYAHYNMIASLNTDGLMLRDSISYRFENFLKEHFAKLDPEELYIWLKKDNISKTLSQKIIVDGLVTYVVSKSGNKTSPDLLAKLVNQIDEDLKMSEKNADLFDYFKKEMSRAISLQPKAVNTVFPNTHTQVNTESTQGYSLEVRGLSTVVALTRIQKTEDQIHMIDYITGHRNDMPKFARDIVDQGNRGVPMTEIVKNAREKLLHESTMVRSLIANTFLAGPSSIIEKHEGKKALFDHILKSVKSENQTIAEQISNALVSSLGETQSLAFAYIFGQKQDETNDKRSKEARILKSLFEAYGVAGVKLGQYLAFTGELKEYRAVLAELQDSAMPLSYFDVIQLLDKHYNGQWPEYYKVKDILGTGSVNIAVLIEDTRTNKELVVSILRENVSVAIEEDFRKLKDFVKELTKTDEGKKKYGYLEGLLGIIKKSVSLELTKKNSFDRQTENRSLYDRSIRVQNENWQLSTPEALHVDEKSFFMNRATGITARKLFMQDQQLYKEIMAQMNTIELDILLGIDESEKPKPISLMANPDFHDGQLLIDVTNKKVFVLDFGQAVVISNEERESAIDLLRSIEMLRMHESVELATVLDFKNRALVILNQLAHQYTNTSKDLLNLEDLSALNGKTERMDIFVQLLSMLSKKNVEIPISVIHWILGLNRQIMLGHKIGRPIENKIRNLLLTRALGGKLKTYNSAHLLKRQLADVFTGPQFKSTYIKNLTVKTQKPAVISCSKLFN